MASKHSSKKTSDWMDDGDGAHWLPSKKNRTRKATTAGETKKRFKASTLKVKTPGKKKATKIKK